MTKFDLPWKYGPVSMLPLLVAMAGMFFITVLIIAIPVAWQAEIDSIVVSTAAMLVVFGELYLFGRGML